MSDFAGWLPDDEPAQDASSAVAPGSWLPPGVRRRQEAEDRAEARLARAEAREREDALEARRDRAVGAAVAAAQARGEDVSPADLVAGMIGRSIGDVFADAIAMADHEDARQAAKSHREAGLEPRHVMVGRSAWPGSEYELERMLRQADELHRDLVTYRARHSYTGALEATRAKSRSPYGERRPDAARSHSGYASHGEITRVVTPDGNAGWLS